MWLTSSMCELMVSLRTSVCKTLIAHFTHVWFLTCVYSSVCIKIITSRKKFIASLTLICSLIVYANVSDEAIPLWKHFTAYITYIIFQCIPLWIIIQSIVTVVSWHSVTSQLLIQMKVQACWLLQFVIILFHPTTRGSRYKVCVITKNYIQSMYSTITVLRQLCAYSLLTLQPCMWQEWGVQAWADGRSKYAYSSAVTLFQNMGMCPASSNMNSHMFHVTSHSYLWPTEWFTIIDSATLWHEHSVKNNVIFWLIVRNTERSLLYKTCNQLTSPNTPPAPPVHKPKYSNSFQFFLQCCKTVTRH